MIYWSGSGLKIEHLNIFLCEIAEVFKYTLFVIIVVNMEKKIRPGGGGYSWEFLVRVCLPILQIPNLY